MSRSDRQSACKIIQSINLLLISLMNMLDLEEPRPKDKVKSKTKRLSKRRAPYKRSSSGR